MKKAAVIGLGAYAGYKLAKATKKFAKKVFEDPDLDFATWERNRQADGYLCRSDSHCSWLDRNFQCQRVGSFGWTPIVSLIAGLGWAGLDIALSDHGLALAVSYI